jgi:hypothetical protein
MHVCAWLCVCMCVYVCVTRLFCLLARGTTLGPPESDLQTNTHTPSLSLSLSVCLSVCLSLSLSLSLSLCLCLSLSLSLSLCLSVSVSVSLSLSLSLSLSASLSLCFSLSLSLSLCLSFSLSRPFVLRPSHSLTDGSFKTLTRTPRLSLPSSAPSLRQRSSWLPGPPTARPALALLSRRRGVLAHQPSWPCFQSCAPGCPILAPSVGQTIWCVWVGGCVRNSFSPPAARRGSDAPYSLVHAGPRRPERLPDPGAARARARARVGVCVCVCVCVCVWSHSVSCTQSHTHPPADRTPRSGSRTFSTCLTTRLPPHAAAIFALISAPWLLPGPAPPRQAAGRAPPRALHHAHPLSPPPCCQLGQARVLPSRHQTAHLRPRPPQRARLRTRPRPRRQASTTGMEMT